MSTGSSYWLDRVQLKTDHGINLSMILKKGKGKNSDHLLNGIREDSNKFYKRVEETGLYMHS